MAFKPRSVLPDTAFTLPAVYYANPAVFAREQDVFFRSMWMGAGRLEDIPTRGAYLTISLAGDSVIVVRASDAGDVRAYYNVCRHRGTQLCDASRGTFAGAIQCPYHAWTYDFGGQLIGAPHMDGSPGFSRDAFPLRALRADVWDGHLFVSAAQTGPSLRDQLAGLDDKFRPWGMTDLRRAARITYDVKANWKLIIQNYNECLHCPTLHPTLNRLSHYLSGENEPLRATYMGGRMDLGEEVASMSMDGRSPLRPLPNVAPEDCRRVYYYSVFPNFLIAPHPDYVLVHTLWPAAPDRTVIDCDWLVHPSELGRPDFDLSSVTSFWDMTNRQDWHVCELAQAGISSRGYQPGPYSNREDLLYAFDRFIVKTLGDLA